MLRKSNSIQLEITGVKLHCIHWNDNASLKKG